MPTISQLTAVSSVTDTDQVPVYSTDNGDARKASLSVIKTYVLANANFIDATFTNAVLITPDIGTPTAGNLINCIGLPITGGGTGASTANGARSNLGAAKSGANSDITSLAGLTTPLSVAQGGTGLAAPGANGNILTSNGTVWISSAAAVGVTTFGGGTTGLTPSVATSGAVTLAGTLATTNGGTGQTTISAARGAFGSGVSSRKTANYTAVAGDVLACDTIAVGAFTVALPLLPVAGDAPIKIYDAGTTTTVNGFATNNLTIARNGNTICTLAEDVIVSTKGVTIICEYVNGTWRLYNG